MKKTVSANLNGIVFQIDEDAYAKLQNYLHELSLHFDKNEDQEILTDIEARIAELLSEKLNSSKTVITLLDVEDVIARLGHPSEFDEVEEESETESHKEEDKKSTRRKYRKFFRNPENQILGGVCSGIAAYINWDPIIIRILFIILVCVGFGYIIPIYLILWLIVPEARTAAQRLEMKGEDPTLENIKNYMESERFKESATRIGGRLSDFFQAFIKVLFIIIGIVLAAISCFILLGLAIAIIAIIIFAIQGSINEISPFELPTGLILTFFISLFMVIIIPLIAIISGSIRMIRNDKRSCRRGTVWFTICLWLISLFIFIGIAIWGSSPFQPFNYLNRFENFIETNENAIIETRFVDPFEIIDVDGKLNIVLIQAEESLLTVEANSEMMPYIESRVENGILKITNSKHDIINTPDIEVVIYTPTLTQIHISNGAKLTSNACIIVPSLKVSTHLAGKVDMEVAAEHLYINNDNASQVTLQGSAKHVEVKTDNASKIDMKNLHIDKGNININNASKAELGKVEQLTLKANNCAVVKCDSVGVEKSIKITNASSYTKKEVE